jgi:hypothetical protein
MTTTLRQATPQDTQAVKTCVVAAFTLYVERIGKPPGPMLLDFAQHILDKKV